MFLVLGNVAVDEAMHTASWPVPGATVLVGPPARDLGGKGANQALVLARCGVPVRFVATIGTDAAASWIGETLAAEGLDPRHLIAVPGASDRSLIFVAPTGENAIASTSHCSDALSPADAETTIAAAAAGDILITQGGITSPTTAAAFAAARARGLRIVFNPSALRPGFGALLPQADLVVLNLHEAEELTGGGTPEAMLAGLAPDPAQTLVITLGNAGAIGRGPAGPASVPASPASVVDTTGAGDTYLAALAAALFAQKKPLDRAMRDAAAAAAITVSRPGTRAAFPTQAELAAIFTAA